MRKNRLHFNRVNDRKRIRIYAAITLLAALFSIKNSWAETLTLATWNIRWLNQAGYAPGSSLEGRRHAADLKALQSYALQLDADVVALQELGDLYSGYQLFDPKKYRLLMTESLDDQKIAVAIKTNLRYQHHSDYRALARHGGRPGLDLTLYPHASPAIRLLVVHLKNGCHSRRDQKKRSRKDSCKQLKQQIVSINHWINLRAKAGTAFILLGDFNRQLAQADDDLWKILEQNRPQDLSLQRIAPTQPRGPCRVRLWNRSKDRWNTYLTQFKQPIDHIIMGGDSGQWPVRAAELFPYRQQDAYRYNLSDHCPLKLQLERPN